jgi:hypothetical protein
VARRQAAPTDARHAASPIGTDMPTLFKLLAVLCVIGGLIFGAMLGLVAFVHPETRVIIVNVPIPKPKP